MKFYLILFILSYLATYIARQIAIRRRIIDIPNERSSHTIPTPRGGGIAFVGSWYAGLIYEYFFYTGLSSQLFYAFLSGLIIVVVSLADDMWDINPKIRLAAQAASTTLALYFIGGLQRVDLGFYVIENQYLLSIVAFVGIIWFINLFNFIDGIDGHLGTTVAFISLSIGLFFVDGVVISLAACILGFLVWNWQRAKIFMGDVGSTLLGFNVAILMIYYQNVNKSSVIVWLMLSSVFWFDATLTLYRRWRNKEPLMKAHRKHAYQRIVQAGFSHQRTVLSAMFINILIAFLCYFAVKNSVLLVPFLFVTLIIWYFVVKMIDKQKPFV